MNGSQYLMHEVIYPLTITFDSSEKIFLRLPSRVTLIFRHKIGRRNL